MSNLVPNQPPITRLIPLSESRLDRSTIRALQRIRAQQAIATAQEQGTVKIITATTEAALIGCSHISAMETMLADLHPRAEGRLKRIADSGCIALTEVVLQTSQRYR